MRNFTPILALPLLLACVGDVGEGKVAAEVTDAPAAEKTAPAATGTVFAIDTSKSTVKALGAKVTATHPIDFHSWEGSVKVADGKVSDLDFAIDMASLESDHPKLTGHLKKEDFLFVDKFPKATFDATSIADGAKTEGMTHTVTGDLTIRGATKQVSFPAKIAVNDAGVTASTEFVINRQDFGVTYKGQADNLVQDNVVLTVSFTAPATAPSKG